VVYALVRQHVVQTLGLHCAVRPVKIPVMLSLRILQFHFVVLGNPIVAQAVSEKLLRAVSHHEVLGRAAVQGELTAIFKLLVF